MCNELERPFDYPGSIPDEYDEPEQVKDILVLSSSTEDYGDCGEYEIAWRICSVDSELTDEQVTELVRTVYYSEHCQHSYDCCGRWYPNSGTWKDLGEERDNRRVILVRQSFTLNV